MSAKLQHVVTQIDEETQVGQCAVCGSVRVYLKSSGWVCGRLPPRLNKRHGPSKGSGAGAKLSHLLTDLNEQDRTAVCVRCGLVRVFKAKGTRARIGQQWVCGRRPAERKVGGVTTHIVAIIDEASRRGTCIICGPVTLIWRPFHNGSGRWGCERTRFSIGNGSFYAYDPNFKAVICPFCRVGHRWDRDQGKACRAKLVEKYGNYCGVCKKEFTSTPRVDHDHATGEVRGLLDRNCNVALGLFKDDPARLQAAIDYLTKPLT